MNSGFVLPNVGPGPDPLSLAELEADFAVLLLHRDFYCSECRQQVRRVKKRYDEFEARDAEIVSVLPEDRETAAEWQKQYHLPFPVVADPDTELGDRYEQPTRFGLLGKLHDVIGRMPAVVLLDLRFSDPIETYAHRGDSRTDRPRIDEILDAIDHAATLDAGNGDDRTASDDAADGPTAEDATEQPSEPPGIDRIPPRAEGDDRPAADSGTTDGSGASAAGGGEESVPDEGAELL
ncbi:peroxiredoxin family protein, partial [Halolamina salina]